MQKINEVNKPTRKNETPQQYPPTKSPIQVPNRRRCQPPRVAKTRTVERQLIGSKRNYSKNTSRKRIQSLINQQTDQYRSVTLHTNVNVQIENVPIKEYSLTFQQTVTYQMPTPKQSDQEPIPITQD